MKFKKEVGGDKVSFDMTPMIDVTFQLVIFFMLTLNFSMDDQAEFIRLPGSELAKPPIPTPERRLTLQVNKANMVLVGGDLVPTTGLKPVLLREVNVLKAEKKSAAETTVVIRADAKSRTGVVQEVIAACQGSGFEKFVLRAKEELPVRM